MVGESFLIEGKTSEVYNIINYITETKDIHMKSNGKTLLK